MLRRISIASLGLSACLELPSVDVIGPQVIASSLGPPRCVEVPVQPTIELQLSEPIDLQSVHSGSIALLAWESVGDCSLTPICESGSCERGTCMEDPVSATDRGDLDDGEFEATIPLEFELASGSAGPDSLLRIRPARPLEAFTRYSLILGSSVRDLGGAGLSDERGLLAGFQRDFVTAAAGSSGPEPMLVSPRPGEGGVPTNLGLVELKIHPPVPWPQPDARVWLGDELGEGIWLENPQACVGWIPGTCVAVSPAVALKPNRRYRVEGGTLHDRLGRSVILSSPGRETWFETADGPDLDPPMPELFAELRTRCVVVWVASDELLVAKLGVDGAVGEQILEPGVSPVGLAALEHGGGEAIGWTLELSDRAGNQSEFAGEVLAGASFASDLPRLEITEVLANPLGTEPDAEFVEIVASTTLDTTGVMLSDLTPSELFASFARGADPDGDPLPAIELDAGQPAIVVSNKWILGAGGDAVPVAGTPTLLVDASLGASGLLNAGEPVTAWVLGESGPVIVSTYGNWIETDATAHGGRSVVGTGDGCDLPDRWRSQMGGTSTPGAVP